VTALHKELAHPADAHRRPLTAAVQQRRFE